MIINLMDRVQKQTESIRSTGSRPRLAYPQEVRYHCRIHNRPETARFIGVASSGDSKDDIEVGLYNTPANFTLNYKMIMQLADGTLPDETWRKYGWKG